MEVYTIRSKELNQNIKVEKDHETYSILTADGVKYSPFEVRIIESAQVPLTISVHNIKKLFGGQIVSAKKGKNKEVTYGNENNLDL